MAMPGRSHRGALPAMDDEERRLAALLRRDVNLFAGAIGERNMGKSGTLDRAWQRLEAELNDAGYEAKAHRYIVDDRSIANVEAVREGHGRGHEIVVVGAHYDSASGAPGADDNASGVAVLLALARAFEGKPLARTIRFVSFVNEEPPHFWNDSMGSLHYAKACKARGDEIVAMLSLESLGYYRDEAGSQKYPPIVSWFYPSRGDFVAFVGNVASSSLVRDVVGSFRSAARFPSEGAALPSFVTGVGWSDQWSFWQVGYPGVMVTDTAPFRNPNYHTANDKPETLDYDRLARVTAGLVSVVAKLAQ
jgi:Zn-dependent M28 family amino/carboxypeptidase